MSTYQPRAALAKLSKKETAFAVWLTLPGAHLARTVATTSPRPDAIIVDCEHGIIPLHGGAAESTSAIALSSPDPPAVFIRIAAVDSASRTWQIKHALDAGAQGVIVPMVNSGADAAVVADWARFPPIGKRGFGSPFAHESWGPGVSRIAYIDVANRDVQVIVQIETEEGYKNVEEIANTPGVDLLLIGPYDFALSLGEPRPNPNPSPKLEEAIQRIKKVSHAAGKKVGIVTLSGADAKKRAAEGFDLVSVTSETSQIIAGIGEQLRQALL